MEAPVRNVAGTVERLYLEPAGFVPDITVGLPFLGGPRRFTAVQCYRRTDGGVVADAAVPASEMQTRVSRDHRPLVAPWRDVITRSRAPFAGLPMGRTTVMGIVNVTPDSFSDGGEHGDWKGAVARGLTLRAAGADILDVGGESTRPGAPPVDPRVETGRVVPVVRELAAAGALVSIDTRHAEVMRAAIDAGARIVNDVSALTGDPESLSVVRDSGVAVVLMHMQGTPRTMQGDPHYDFAPVDVFDYLAGRVEACVAAGIPRDRIAVDPGIGFGKRRAHNLELLRHVAIFHGTGCPVMIGASRKLRGGPADVEPRDRVGASLGAALAAVERGVQILRVHDVATTVEALGIRAAIATA